MYFGKDTRPFQRMFLNWITPWDIPETIWRYYEDPKPEDQACFCKGHLHGFFTQAIVLMLSLAAGIGSALSFLLLVAFFSIVSPSLQSCSPFRM